MLWVWPEHLRLTAGPFIGISDQHLVPALIHSFILQHELCMLCKRFLKSGSAFQQTLTRIIDPLLCSCISDAFTPCKTGIPVLKYCEAKSAVVYFVPYYTCHSKETELFRYFRICFYETLCKVKSCRTECKVTWVTIYLMQIEIHLLCYLVLFSKAMPCTPFVHFCKTV